METMKQMFCCELTFKSLTAEDRADHDHVHCPLPTQVVVNASNMQVLIATLASCL